MSWPLLGIPLSLHTVTALVAICAAVVIYAQVLALFASHHIIFGAESSGQPKQQQANRRGQGSREGVNSFDGTFDCDQV